MIRVRGFDPEEWALLRSLRIESLVDAPEAFGSTAERDREYGEDVWRSRTAKSGVAERDGEPVGLVGIVPIDGACEMVGMWVRAAARGQGAGEALVEWCVERARQEGWEPLTCGVVDGNAVAQRLYERCGFVYTGVTEPLYSNPSLTLRRMRFEGAGPGR
jgi:ribosomal protein S18 acetylase RimI-like enzyme